MAKPIVVEFTATPDSGKAASMKKVKEMLELQNLRVEIVTETPGKIRDHIPKENSNFGIWTIVTAVVKIKEEVDNPKDVIIVDRCLLDRLFWNLYSYRKGNITFAEKQKGDGVIYDSCLKIKPDMLVVLTIPTEEIIKIEGEEKQFISSSNVNLYNTFLEDFSTKVATHADETKLLQICTLNESSDQYVQKICNNVFEILRKKENV